jgi:alpha-galactosidase
MHKIFKGVGTVSLSFIFSCALAQQTAVYTPASPANGILTPLAKETPQINSPAVFGVRPGNPVLYNIPVTGKRPRRFVVTGLPEGLKLDATTGRITGALPKVGKYLFKLKASNSLGKDSKAFTIIVGENIALTPPMGWNSYNVYGEGVDEDKAMHAARAMVAFHLNEHGWTYINCDDGWQGTRDPKTLTLQAEPNRFKDIKGYIDNIHAMGLKAGVYSSPWAKTYGGRIGGSSQNADGSRDSTFNKNSPHNKKTLPFAIAKYRFTRQDAQQFATWGFDYLKYDWGPVEGPETKEMHDALRSTGRDILFSLSNNHTMTLIRNIADVAPYAEAWRTTTDINDNWKRVSDIGFNQDQWAKFVSPGHFIDPDMLVVGYVGWRNAPRPTHLTIDEQYTHISLWSLLSAPLLLGCDMEKLDNFTINLITNDEVIAVDQDELAKQAIKVSATDSLEVYSKPLSNGSLAVGLFNRSQTKAIVKTTWDKLGIKGKQTIRDLWRQKYAAVADEQFVAEVAPHGVVLVKITPIH